MKKLTTLLASAALVSGVQGCAHQPSTDMVEYVSNVDSQQSLIKRLKAQTGQAGEIFARVYLMPNSNASQPKQDENYYTNEKVMFSLDNKTVVVPKPENGYYEKDLFVRIVETKKCPEEQEDISLQSLFNSLVNEDKQEKTDESECSIEDIVMVHHYSAKENSKVGLEEIKRGKSHYTVNDKTGKPEMGRESDSYGKLWVPRDAFGVYLLDENNKVISKNLLAEQDIKVLDDGSAVLKTEELGLSMSGKYKVKVVTKYKKEHKRVDDLRKVKSWDDIRMIMRVGMALGSLEHIYSGPDPMDNDGDSYAPYINLLMSNLHVWSNSLLGGEVGGIEENGKIKMIYVTIGALPFAKLDDRVDGEWIPVSPYNGLYSPTLDVAITKLARPIRDKNFPTIIWNTEEPKTGEQAIVVGHPLGIADTVVNTRAVIGKTGHYAGGDFPNAILFFGDIQGGNSGGGLYNMKGEFVGIPSASYIHIYKDTIEAAIEIPQDALKKALGNEYNNPVDFEKLKAKKDTLVRKLAKIPEVKSMLDRIGNPEKAKDFARDLYTKTFEEYVKGNRKHIEQKRFVIVDTGINLARSAVEIQKWLNSLGVNIGQRIKKDWSD